MIKYDAMTGREFSKFVFVDNEDENEGIFSRLKYLHSSEIWDESHFIALDNNKVVGNLAIQLSPYNKAELWLKHVTVDQEYQNQGIATNLAEMLFKYLELRPELYLLRSSPSEMGTKYFSGIMHRLIIAYPHIKVVTPQRKY
jgi:ribosomal protein S18 acetylase RimI-like enzyme